MAMSSDEWGYLRALVSRDIRKHEAGIDNFDAREGQTPDEAAEILAHMQRKQEFRWRLYHKIDALRRATS